MTLPIPRRKKRSKLAKIVRLVRLARVAIRVVRFVQRVRLVLALLTVSAILGAVVAVLRRRSRRRQEDALQPWSAPAASAGGVAPLDIDAPNESAPGDVIPLAPEESELHTPPSHGDPDGPNESAPGEPIPPAPGGEGAVQEQSGDQPPPV